MPLCSTCQRLIPTHGAACTHCGAVVAQKTTISDADAAAERRKHRERNHAITGVILIAILSTVLGLPSSLLPGGLLQTAIIAVLFGAPLGWLVSRSDGGLLTGAAVGTGFGIAIAVILALVTQSSLLAALFSGIVSGLIPGAIMGVHVEHDR